ncbi:MAG TPA: hypothetical protein VIL79_06935 [Thermoleophilia bacterium]|jgi:hypothetical protein
MTDQIAEALRDVFQSPNVPDSNFEIANVVDALASVAEAMVFAAKHLGNGDASTQWGALEAHGKAMLDAAETVSDGLHDLADAVRETRVGP